MLFGWLAARSCSSPRWLFTERQFAVYRETDLRTVSECTFLIRESDDVVTDLVRACGSVGNDVVTDLVRACASVGGGGVHVNCMC